MIQKIINNVAFRFIVVGGSVAVLQLTMLYILHDVFSIDSLVSSIIAFIISVFINFTFQKFWSFRDPSQDRISIQFGFFLTNALINLGINIVLMSLWLNVFNINTYIAQAITLIIIAFANFFIYKIIFNYKKNHHTV